MSFILVQGRKRWVPQTRVFHVLLLVAKAWKCSLAYNSMFSLLKFKNTPKNLKVNRLVNPQLRQKVYSFKGVSLDGRPLYLDAQSTTPVDPRVLDAMLPTMTGTVEFWKFSLFLIFIFVEQFGNPHSTTHMYGWENTAEIEKSREVRIFHVMLSFFSFIQKVASLIGADPKEIIFTSGATESNNIAIKGIYLFLAMKR